MHLYQLKG